MSSQSGFASVNILLRVFGLMVMFGAFFLFSLVPALGFAAGLMFFQVAILFVQEDASFPLSEVMLGCIFLMLYVFSFLLGDFRSEVLPYTGIIIYCALFLGSAVSLFSNNPFAGGTRWCLIWMGSFFLSALSGYLLLPSIWYFYVPFVFTGITAVAQIGTGLYRTVAY
jgi:hypothetical protein